MKQKLRHLTVTAAEMTASCAYCTLQVQQTVSPSRVLVRRWLTTAVLTQDHIRDQEQMCQVQNHYWASVLTKGCPSSRQKQDWCSAVPVSLPTVCAKCDLAFLVVVFSRAEVADCCPDCVIHRLGGGKVVRIMYKFRPKVSLHLWLILMDSCMYHIH